MSVAVTTRMDFTAFHGARVRRLVHTPDLPARLGIIQRIVQQHASGVLVRYPETRVEQSFNEQLFARVFGYQTQFSHGTIPFHLLPKNVHGGTYDDFSLGYFGEDPDRTIASAELKGADVDLDGPQAERGYHNRSPVQQAFRTARRTSTCRWVLVSNYRELRLYTVDDPSAPLATVDFLEARTLDDVAAMLACFDRSALLGDGVMPPEVAMAKDPAHPSQPVPGGERSYRVVVRSVPTKMLAHPLYKAEGALRTAFQNAPLTSTFLPDKALLGPTRPRVTARDGWVAVEGGHPQKPVSVRAAVSRFGEFQLSVRVDDVPPHPTLLDGRPLQSVRVDTIRRVHEYFIQILAGLSAQQIGAGQELQWTSEVRLVLPARLDTGGHGLEAGSVGWGDAQEPDLHAGPFPAKITHPDGAAETAADLVCELAIQFRNEAGGVALDPKALAEQIRDAQKPVPS